MVDAVLLQNVHVFDGTRFAGPQDLRIENHKIALTKGESRRKIDGQNGYLIPGLIDSHVHLTDHAELHAFREHGQTTVLDMACWPAQKMNSFRNQPGLPDIRSAGVAATTAGTEHSALFHWPVEHLLESTDEAERWVETRVAEGSDYIKIICDVPGPSLELVRALREAARRHDKMTVAHASKLHAFRQAIDCDFDVITHLPFDAPLTEDDAKLMKQKGLISTPTLIMDRAHAIPEGHDFNNALKGFKLLHGAGVPILASTDACSAPGELMPKHGPSLLDEMEMMVSLGMSELEVLRSATDLPAKYFGLHDRGSIMDGMRADLVLLGSNPLHDISAVRDIKMVWCNGQEWRKSGI